MNKRIIASIVAALILIAGVVLVSAQGIGCSGSCRAYGYTNGSCCVEGDCDMLGQPGAVHEPSLDGACEFPSDTCCCWGEGRAYKLYFPGIVSSPPTSPLPIPQEQNEAFACPCTNGGTPQEIDGECVCMFLSCGQGGTCYWHHGDFPNQCQELDLACEEGEEP